MFDRIGREKCELPLGLSLTVGYDGIAAMDKEFALIRNDRVLITVVVVNAVCAKANITIVAKESFHIRPTRRIPPHFIITWHLFR